MNGKRRLGIGVLTTLLALGLAVAAYAMSSSSCVQAEHVAVPGLKDYYVATCCSMGCGGKCCRCGSATGYKPGCTVRCSVAVFDGDESELASLGKALEVHGRLIHVTTGEPLSDERVSLTLPGGRTLETTSADDGKFVLNTATTPGELTLVINAGNQLSVTRNERDAEESVVYKLFISKEPADPLISAGL